MRRPLLWLLVVVLVVAGGLGTWLVRERAGQTGTLPDAPQEVPGPVLLVPGYGGDTAGLVLLAERLRAQGRHADVVALPGGGTGDLRAQAAVLDTAVEARLGSGARSVDVVGYSAGGVVARVWAQHYDGAERARRVVTVGSPHHGTSVATLAAAFAPDACPEACRQLVPGSDLLAGLPAVPLGPVWTSVWSGVDEVVRPPASAELDGAVNVRLDGVCPDAAVGHAELVTDPLPVGVVLRALGTEPLTAAPGAADCAALRSAGTQTLR